jgi:uncharacterized protein YbjT (DUF2867 family)
VVAADRRPERLHEQLGGAISAVRFDFREQQTWLDATRGAEHVFLLRPPAIADVEKTLIPFVDFVRSRGAEHVVFLSVEGAGKNPLVPHHAVERHLRSRSVNHTNLRPGFFAQNLESAYHEDIVRDGRIYVPAGLKPVNFIDVRDIAEVTALVFSEPHQHRGQSYTLAGPKPETWSAIANTLTVTLGRRIRYEPASVFGYVRHLLHQGKPPGAVAVQTTLHVMLRFGGGATVDPTLEQLLGRPGRSVHDYIREHASCWALPPHSDP